ncbi:MAG: DNA cytosine methyltransferase [Proteobacteria bacterium]|nr:DNA cytosine methyltransferase [Pseudomonadota bacterium]
MAKRAPTEGRRTRAAESAGPVNEEALPKGASDHDSIASVVDLFCGAGGLSYGLLREGLGLKCGIDVDEACRYPFETNTGAPFIRRDVTALSGREISAAFAPNLPTVLVGCAPCQPFSLYTQARVDPKWALLKQFTRLVDEARPDIVSMENVQRLRRFRDGSLLHEFIDSLEGAGYHVWCEDVYCPDYGIPQSRTRLVLLASRFGPIRLVPPRVKPEDYRTVADAIKGLPALDAGEADKTDPMHAASSLSPLNKKRIQASKPGGTWRDWPSKLVATCHLEEKGAGYSSVYGRMRWDEPAPTVTTQFFGFGNGRFGHPDQDRAISLREGAILQTFPRGYRFVPASGKIEFKTLGRMIGNAVPVLLARSIGKSIRVHLAEIAAEGGRGGEPRRRYAAE